MVEYPKELLLDPRLSVYARFIYGVIVSTPTCSLRGLASLAGLCREAVRSHCQSLREAGWVDIEESRRGFIVRASAPLEVQKRWALEALALVDQAGFKQEAVMRILLDALVADRAYIDNFRPEFLRDPETQHLLEYDRFYYMARRAFEYNGEQHYRPTQKYPDEQAFREQQTRDLVKESLSARNGVRLTIVEAKDLSIDGMLAKAEGLPLRNIQRDGPYAKTLEQMCRKYAGHSRGRV